MPMLRVADRSKPWGERGTVGSTINGRKPRELARYAAHGVPTQGAHSGHEDCRHCGKSRAAVERERLERLQIAAK